MKALAITLSDSEVTGEFWTENEHTSLSLEWLGREQSVGAKDGSRKTMEAAAVSERWPRPDQRSEKD